MAALRGIVGRQRVPKSVRSSVRRPWRRLSRNSELANGCSQRASTSDSPARPISRVRLWAVTRTTRSSDSGSRGRLHRSRRRGKGGNRDVLNRRHNGGGRRRRWQHNRRRLLVLQRQASVRDGVELRQQRVDRRVVCHLPGSEFRPDHLSDLRQRIDAFEQMSIATLVNVSSCFCTLTRQSSMTWATLTAARRRRPAPRL